MKTFKTEREWKDLERADKIVFVIGVIMWTLMSTGVYFQNHNNHQQLKQNILKTEMVKHR